MSTSPKFLPKFLPRFLPRFLPGFLEARTQRALVETICAVLTQAPPFRPVMPKTGQAFSVMMSNCGPLGWVSDRQGYRYQSTHPASGRPWPQMPEAILEIWEAVANYPHPPEACLINLYRQDARMGSHRDADEEALDAPVVSLSLGAPALFRFGGLSRRDPSRSVKLSGGDLAILEGQSRLIYHGIDRILAGPGDLLQDLVPGISRINLTLRRVTQPE